MPACTTENLSVAYGTVPVLHQVDLRVPTGVVMGVVGPNGAGKSTLIAAMLGLVTPLTGRTRLLGRRLARVRRPGRRERDRARDAMDQTGIADLARRQIGELSGGQRQRVFLARALAQGPELYVMDEPFQGIDAKSQQAIVAVLHRLREQGR